MGLYRAFSSEEHEFQAETKKLLDIVTHRYNSPCMMIHGKLMQ